MPITVTCPSCHRTFRVGDHFAGRRGLCPDCGSVVAVPVAEPAQLDPLPDEPVYAPRRRRRNRPRRPSPRDHLPAWRRVSVGFLVQQLATVLLLPGLAAVIAAATVLADDPGDFPAEPNGAQVIARSLGLLALFVGFVGQVIGRLVSASTPVRAPRALGILSAVASVLQLLGFCLVGVFVGIMEVEAEQGNPPDPALETLTGLCALGWMFGAVLSESFHGFAVGSVGRVLRAGGARALGNGLGIFVAVLGLLALFVFCGLWAWVGNNNPQNPVPNAQQDAALVAWLIGAAVLNGAYWLLDVVLLQLGRSAVARIGAEADERDDHDDRWD